MADVFEEETEPTVSLGEYLEELEDQELEADLILGGDEGKDCTYSKGYMKRQAIFSCLTCTPEGNAGVCTACSLSCHDGHEIIELWTKRNFKCDCGNSKFGEFFCKLFPNKDPENVENSYNHNFKGQYCTCGRPYPDPDLQEQVEMIQCCICEDWFHEEHVGLQSSEIPRDEEGEPLYEDFICNVCYAICSFFSLYPQTIWATVKNPNVAIASEEIDVEGAPPASESSETLDNSTCSLRPCNAGAIETNINSKNGPDGKGKSLEANSEGSSRVGGPSAPCLLGVDLASSAPSLEKSKGMFLAKNWRQGLCGCAKCAEFYSQKGIAFLLDKDDSIAEYERMAQQKRDEKLQQEEGAELNFLNKLGHVQKMEVLSGIADMKDELRSFMESCDTSKPISADDIHQMFDNLAKKRRRME